jgi:hypothetical protein
MIPSYCFKGIYGVNILYSTVHNYVVAEKIMHYLRFKFILISNELFLQEMKDVVSFKTKRACQRGSVQRLTGSGSDFEKVRNRI